MSTLGRAGAGSVDDTAAAVPTVAVLGSCVTRDVFNARFNPDWRAMWDCVLTQNQSSIASIMSDPIHLSEAEIGHEKEYDQWNVRTDTSKEFLRDLIQLAPDYLVLDFFGDAHFGFLELPDGRVLTNNRWKLWPTPYYAALQQRGDVRVWSISDDPDAYVERWTTAYDALLACVREHIPSTTVVVHRGQNASRLWRPAEARMVDIGQHRPRPYPLDPVELNERWSRLNAYAAAADGVESIDLWDRDYATFADHPWGAFYVHYTLDYYQHFLAALNALHLRRGGVGEDLQRVMIEQIRTAGDDWLIQERADVATAVGRYRRRLRSQRRRLEEGRAETEAQPSAGRRTRLRRSLPW